MERDLPLINLEEISSAGVGLSGIHPMSIDNYCSGVFSGSGAH
jgi:hypothetical protein